MMNWKIINVDRVKGVVSPAIPPRFVHWKTLLLVSVVIWIISFFTFDQGNRDAIAAMGWILLTIAIGWRFSQPPFILGPFPLSPWIASTFFCYLIYQRTSDTDPTLAIQAWPIIAAILIAVVEWFKRRYPENSPPPLGRKTLMNIILVHILVGCWIDIYFLIVRQIEKNPERNPRITQPRPAFEQPDSPFLTSENQQRLNLDEES
ncbi:MAG: DUF5357 family protein [Cyanobacteriota bacterium]|nr:DUF5357 family protein [Cyanobacteriota bacterium]